jgi:hypothetical protein
MSSSNLNRRTSQYAIYPLPFFDRKRLSTWAVQPSGNYSADCELGEKYAVEFLNSCDGTLGWSALLPAIVADMICRGPDGVFPNGHPKTNGVVIGFMGTIGKALAVSR